MVQRDMRRFWERRARENAFYFVDNRLDYRNPDLDRFWTDGERDLDALLGSVGASIEPHQRVVEIGCGVGRLTRVLAARGAAVQALDVSERMLELARASNSGLENVEWMLGDGATLDGIESGSADVCISHVVFQHIPDPAITLGYIREIGRVLVPGGWAAFQISNESGVHRRRTLGVGIRERVLAAVARGPRGLDDRRWRGSMVEVDALRQAASNGSMEIERIVGEGTQLCCVLTRRDC